MAQLTAGAVNSMNNNQAAGIKPTLQLIDVKKIPPANDHAMAQDRYRLDISDGTQMMPAMLATQLNFMMDSGQVRGDPSPCRRRRITPPPHPAPFPSHMRVGPHLGASTHLWRCVLRWQLQKFSIVRLDEFMCHTVQNRRIIILLNLTPIQACNEQIGYPVRSTILTG